MTPSTAPSTSVENFGLPRSLGDGLVLRFATPADREPLAELTGRVFGMDHFDAPMAAWTRDYMSPDHPACGPDKVLLVEDTARGVPVSTMVHIPQTWTYAGIPFGVGRPEAVATDPAYRKRGLVRAQFQVFHAQSAAMGHLVQGITGIPWYYLQFGYEYALELGGGQISQWEDIPALPEGQAEPFRLRSMTAQDIEFAGALYDQDSSRMLVTCPRPRWLWERLLTWYSRLSFEARPFWIIETAGGQPVGYCSAGREIEDGKFGIIELAVVEGQSMRAILPSLMRALKKEGEAEGRAQNKPVNKLYWMFDPAHPAVQAGRGLFSKSQLPYAWYLRVADVPAFLRRIAPVLEERVARSPLAGYTGAVQVTEFVSGWCMNWQAGKLVSAEPVQGLEWYQANALFRPYTFMQLMFGYRSYEFLDTYHAGTGARNDEIAILLNTLFPQQPSRVIGVT